MEGSDWSDPKRGCRWWRGEAHVSCCQEWKGSSQCQVDWYWPGETRWYGGKE